MHTVLLHFGSFQARCIVQRDFMAKFIYIEIQYVLKCMHRFFTAVKQNVGYIYYLHDNRNDSITMATIVLYMGVLMFSNHIHVIKRTLYSMETK